jgi:hypothetical protein
MWYKDEAHESHTYFADSDDLYHWQEKGCAIEGEPHEGPNVFYYQNYWWLIADYWKGQWVYRSDDCLNWLKVGTILDKSGIRKEDQGVGHHADVLTVGKDAYIFYFTHPNQKDQKETTTSLQVAHLYEENGTLTCNRNEEYDFVLPSF